MLKEALEWERTWKVCRTGLPVQQGENPPCVWEKANEFQDDCTDTSTLCRKSEHISDSLFKKAKKGWFHFPFLFVCFSSNKILQT